MKNRIDWRLALEVAALGSLGACVLWLFYWVARWPR